MSLALKVYLVDLLAQLAGYRDLIIRSIIMDGTVNTLTYAFDSDDLEKDFTLRLPSDGELEDRSRGGHELKIDILYKYLQLSERQINKDYFAYGKRMNKIIGDD